MKKLILLRHGQSVWNKENKFTGWADVDLTEQGVIEARNAGKVMLAEGLIPDYTFTSYLKRAIKTLNYALEEMDSMQVQVEKSWKLNEKHYGDLQGLNKAETAAKYGEEQVKLWRRAFDIAPNPLQPDDPRHPANDHKYAKEVQTLLPATESLKDTIQRIVPYWDETILPAFKKYDTILVVAHGNSLRGIVMHLKNLSPEEILEVNIPTGIPYVFDLDTQLHPVKDAYLSDPETLDKLMAEVASQGKSK